jgi:hypothetical protein
MASIDTMHQIQTNVMPDKDPIAKMTIPNGMAQSGVSTLDEVQKQKIKEAIVTDVANEMTNNPSQTI